MTSTVLVTGASGTLGRDVLPAAVAAGYCVRAVSRHEHRDDGHEQLARSAEGDVRWHRCDLLTDAGLTEAVDGVDVILHCATQPTGGKDVIAARNLLTAARRTNVGHVVYISIVGVDRIPFGYYRTKLQVEQLLASSQVGHTVLRATQFHNLVAATFSAQRFVPVVLALRGTRFQPISTRDVASRMVELAAGGPQERAPDIGGPEIREHADLAKAYLSWRGSRRPVVTMRLPGKIAAGYRAGANLAPSNPAGTENFEDYLRRS